MVLYKAKLDKRGGVGYTKNIMPKFDVKSKNSPNYLDIADNLNGVEKSLFALAAIDRIIKSGKNEMTIVEVGPGGGAAAGEISKFFAKNKIGRKIKMIFVDKQKIKSKNLHEIAAKMPCKTEFICSDMKFLDEKIREKVDLVIASAVLHEVYSYGGGSVALNKAIKAVARILKPGGFFAYRDVSVVPNMSVHEREKHFYPRGVWSLFIAKFLPYYLANSEHPYHNTTDDEIIIDQNGTEVYIDEIRENMGIFLSAPVGIHREIQRHFITFRDHLWRNGALGISPILDGKLSNDFVDRSRGMKNIHFTSGLDDQRLSTMSEIDSDGNYVMESKLFDEISEIQMKEFLRKMNAGDKVTSEIWKSWLSREGSETYTYLTLNELFAYVAIKSMKTTGGDIILLAVNPEDIAIISRNYYNAYLRKTLSASALVDAKQLVLFTAVDLRDKKSREFVAKNAAKILQPYCSRKSIVEIYRNLEGGLE